VARIRTSILTGSVLPLVGLFPVQAMDYYISPTGSDSALGTLAQPFETIQKAASVMVAGDTAYIRAGVYRETVTPKNSGTQSAPITYMAYNGESVTVSGADVIPASSWNLSSGNIYKAPMSWDLGAGSNQVFLDGQMMIEARWPNTTLDFSHPIVAQTGGGSVSTHGGSNSLSTATITSSGLPARPAGYWNGAMINICLGVCWGWQTGTVTDSPAGNSQLSFTYHEWTGATDVITPSSDNPFFLWGKLSELDSPGEWFREGAASKSSAGGTLYLWTPQSDSPAQHLVEVKRRQFAFNLSGLSFIEVQGLGLFSAAVTSDANSQYLLLDGLSAQYLTHYLMSSYDGGVSIPCCTGLEGGVILQGTNNVIRNSTFGWAAGDGVMINGSGHRFFNNLIHDTGYYALGDSSLAAAGLTPADGAVIAWNTLHNSGREGLILPNEGDGGFTHGRIIHNEIYDYGLQTNDLGCVNSGGINGQGTEIAYNSCHDNPSPSPYGGGIYLDASSSNFVVHHNVTWNVENALQLTAGGPHYIYNNTLNGNANSMAGGGLNGTVFENNIFAETFNANQAIPTMSNNIFSGTDPQFVDPTNNNYQLKPTSPAIGAGIVIPPYTNGYSGSAPDIGAYDHTKPAWKTGVQSAATVSAPSYAPTLIPGTIAVVTGSVPFDSGTSVLVTDGANVDLPAPLIYVIASPPQLAFQVPSTAAPGVAMITITNGDGTISLSSAPLFTGSPPVTISASLGSGQGAVIGMPFGATLQATVTDGEGNPVPGAAVTFAMPTAGPGGIFSASAVVTTNGSGVAASPAFSANAVAGSYTVTASAAGVASPASFTLTNMNPAPSITPGGVVPFYSTATAIQPGEWVSIYGAGFANSASTWNGDFPTSLGGVTVTIDGKAAYLSYVSPTQIDLQAPDDSVTGSVPVVVTTAGGTFTSTVTLVQFAPSFILFDSKHVAGIIYRFDGSGAYGAGSYDIIGPTGNSLGYATVAARAGDSVSLFALGMGPTSPKVAAGQAFSGVAATTNPVNLLVNGVGVTPTFAGISGAGLYQINLTIPAGLGSGDVPLAATVGGAQTPSYVVISLQ
jgi:uncharacterized protein (TIGR03437 family)